MDKDNKKKEVTDQSRDFSVTSLSGIRYYQPVFWVYRPGTVFISVSGIGQRYLPSTILTVETVD
jgi:hypothetical protein